MRQRGWILGAVPVAIVFVAFWLLPMARLALAGFSASDATDGHSAYVAALTQASYWRSLWSTLWLSALASIATLVIALPVGRYLAHHRHFPGRGVLVALLTFPLAFPGVVVGFLIIMLAGRQGLLAQLSQALFGQSWSFAYGLGGLFTGYLYFSLPRAIGVLAVATENIDPSWTEAARTLGAGGWRRFVDVELPALSDALFGVGAMCFATCIGAFGTVFTLGTQINVLPMVIYNEFTNYADIPLAAALSLLLGLVTWVILFFTRTWLGDQRSSASA